VTTRGPDAGASDLDAAPGALDGLRVVELGEGVAAPYAAKLFADLGAEVVKTEPPAGDRTRAAGPFPGDAHPGDGADPKASALFLYENTNKRGVVLDVHAVDGGHALDELVARADVLLTDRPPAELDALGLTAARLAERHPKLVTVAITPFGLDGPRAGWRGDELTAWATSGLAHGTPGLPDSVEDGPAEPPLHPAAPIAEMITGVTAAVGALMALRGRDAPEEEARGAFIDLSMQAAVASLEQRDHIAWSYGGLSLNRLATSIGRMPNCYLPCADGYVAVAAPWDHQWERLVVMLGEPEWARSPLFVTAEARGENWEALKLLLSEWSTSLRGEEITRLASEHGLPFFHFHSVAAVAGSAQVAARGSLVEARAGEATLRMPGAPMQLHGTPWLLRRPAPALGEHTREVLGGWLGWDAAALARLDAERDTARRPASRRRLETGEAPLDTAHEVSGGPLPLAGLRVLDLGQVVAIPFATQWLARMGAEVLLVESAKHLTTRELPPYGTGGPRHHDNAGHFNLLNGAKLGLQLDLETEQGRELVRRLVPQCDVLVDNFKTGVLERMGLGADAVRALHPSIVQLSLGAFGRTGPMRHQLGLHSAVNLFSGVADVTGYVDGAPRLLGGLLPDAIAGAHVAWALLAALRHRDRTGEGQYIDGAMYETLLPLIAAPIADHAMNGREPRRIGNRDAHCVPHGVYPARGEDEWVAISVADDEEWRALRDAVGREGWARDAELATAAGRRAREDALDGAIAAWTRERTPLDAAEELQRAGVTAAPVLRSAEVLSDLQLLHRGFVVESEHPVSGRRRHYGVPWRGAGVPNLTPAPLLGQHTRDVLGRLLGLDAPALDELEAAGVFT
jgi:crotonobetainyl-CoA:carnitine CoA-transferase CaiB-like acyl-CoA transferase